METHDPKKLNPSVLSWNDGHGGVHVCHKCGWPYPNPHPSSKIRRAHKKVCGTIDKYRLENDAQEKTHMDGYDGEPKSSDEFETPSDKTVERTISRMSSSGVGSRSSHSNRSEEEVFTDAGTEFNENPAVIGREASGGAIQRFYSMQNENEVDDNKPAEENPIAGEDNSCTTDPLKDNQLRTVPSVESEKEKVKAGMASEAHISTNHSLVSTAANPVMLEIGNSIDQNIIQSSELSSKLDIASERGKEILSSKDGLDPRTSYTDTPEESSLLETDGVKDDGRFNVLDSSERDKIESCSEVDSSGNFYSPVHQGEAINSGNGHISKSDLVEKCDSKICIDDNVYALGVPDVLSLEQHPKIAVKDLDHIRGKNNISEDVSVFSLEKQEESQNSVDDKKTFGEPDYIPEANSCNADVSIFKNEVVVDLNSRDSEDRKGCGTEEKKPFASMGNIFPEGAAMDAGETTSNPDSIRSNFEDDREYFTVMDKDVNKVSEDDLAIKPTLDEVTLHDLEHFHTSNDMGDDENITAEGVILIGNEIGDGAAMENVGTEMGAYDSKEPGRIADEYVAEQPEIQRSDKNVRMEECMVGDATDATLKTGDHMNSISKVEVDEDDEPSLQSLTAVKYCSNEKFAEGASSTAEGERVIKQPVTIPAIDTLVDSGSVADSLDGNWGSVSVISATSDATPTSDTIALNHPRAIEGEENPSMVQKLVNENQHSENQVFRSDVEIEQMESSSEIHSSKEQQHMNSALQTSRTPTVADVANDRNRANKGKEIITKVTNWDSGNQNTPLKTLLGEATARSRAESPIHHNQSSTSNSTFAPKKDVIPGTDDGFSAKQENVILNSDQPEMESALIEMGKEWNSPARYPVKIKTDKRRPKNRGYWVPFLCCSSVNAR